MGLQIMQILNGGGGLGPLRYKLITIVNCYLEKKLLVRNWFILYCLRNLIGQTLERYIAGARAVRSDQSYPESPTGSALAGRLVLI